MKPAFCTIITVDFISYALALRKSLLDFGDDLELYLLVADGNESLKKDFETNYPGSFILLIEGLCKSGMGKSIYDKYYHSDINAFRWSMKPVLITYLLQKKNYDKVIYTDADIYFYNDYHFLLEDLDTLDVLLTPHWRSSDPYADLTHFKILYTSGLYNGGFVGVNKNAIAAMEWWAMACEYSCVINPGIGMFGDQVHLNLLPIYFDNIGIVKHRGCNVANWNMIECKRTLSKDGTHVLINNEYPIVFIHFAESTIDGILSGADGLLMPYLKQYAMVNDLSLDKQAIDNSHSSEKEEEFFGLKKKSRIERIKRILKRIIH